MSNLERLEEIAIPSTPEEVAHFKALREKVKSKEYKEQFHNEMIRLVNEEPFGHVDGEKFIEAKILQPLSDEEIKWWDEHEYGIY